MESNKQTKSKPPANTRWIMGNHDLPQTYDAAGYRVTPKAGDAFELTLSKRKRQAVEALMIGPVYCASPIRLSDVVLILRRDDGLDIDTAFYVDDSEPIPTRFGVYTLLDGVERVFGQGAVA